MESLMKTQAKRSLKLEKIKEEMIGEKGLIKKLKKGFFS